MLIFGERYLIITYKSLPYISHTYICYSMDIYSYFSCFLKYDLGFYGTLQL